MLKAVLICLSTGQAEATHPSILQIVQILKDAGRPPEGKQIGVITKELINFQLANPSEGKDRAQEYILARKF